MATYGSGTTYGSGVNYGAGGGGQAGAILWRVMFDWNGDGIFDGDNEGGRLLDLNIERGRKTFLTPQGGGFERVRPGRATLRLDNEDRRFDPRNTSSPLYPNVKPGRKVYVSAFDLVTEVNEVLFIGRIDDIVPLNAPGGGEVQIECLDYLAGLNDQVLSLGTSTQNTTITNAMLTLLEDVRGPAGQIDTDTQPVIVLSVSKQNAGSMIHALADAGMGTYFVNRYGAGCYYARNHTYPAATALDQAILLNDPIVSQPWNEVYNHVTAIAARPIKMQPSVIYFLAGPVQLTAATPLTFEVNYSPATNAQVNGYTVNEDRFGTGDDLTDDTTVTASLGLDGGTVTVTCTSDGWLTLLEIRGSAWNTVEEHKLKEDATSQATYGLRRMVLQSQFLQDPNYALSHATALLAFAKDDRESVTVQIEARPATQFGLDLMQPIALTAATLDISATYYIMGLHHQWRHGAQGVITTVWLSKILADSSTPTAAETLNEPAQAPLGYQNPAGDQQTINNYYPPPFGDDLPGSGSLSPAYVQLSFDTGVYSNSGASISDGFISWGSDPETDISPTGSVNVPWIDAPGGTYTHSVSGTEIRLQIAGVYYCELWVCNSPTTGDEAWARAEIILYNSAGTTPIFSSGERRTDLASTTPGELSVSRISTQVAALFPVAVNQHVIKCKINFADGFAFGAFRAFRIPGT